MAEKKSSLPVLASQQKTSLDSDLALLCKMMRIMSERDTARTLPQVLKLMLIEGKGKAVGGSELSRLSGLNRITVIHHLKRLEEAGFVRRIEGKYVLRFHSAEEMLIEFRKEMEKAFMEMDELARQIDEQFAELEREFATNYSALQKKKK
ncbi:MAG: ArsR family transcriptional regulator [Candidatus Micrarchaeota archaeon]|nr:ArsR family transcriptional regulator [Candidatus Micrarchaeota archaeon]